MKPASRRQRKASGTQRPRQLQDGMGKREYQATPRGLRRLLPTSMQVPPVPVDDFVAVILGTRYLARQAQGEREGKS